MSLLGGLARCVGCLVGQPPGLGQLLRSLLDELLGPLLRCLGLALSILDLVVDFLLNLLQLRFGISLRLFAFPLNRLVRGLLSLGDPLLDAPACLAVYLL